MISEILMVVQILALGTIGSMLLYLAFLSIMAYKEKDTTSLMTQSLRKFAVVIPAYNEESRIGKTLQSLRQVDYPKEWYDIIVIADNCTDSTAKIAQSNDALVYERYNQEKRGKGYALRWLFDKLIMDTSDYDSVIVIDADSIVSSNLLRVMNKYREKGAQVIQGYLTVHPKPNVWTSEIIRIGFTLYNYVRLLGRRALGFPAGLRGNGMCFTVETLKEVPWDAYSLTEDLEYGLKLLFKDINVVFAPEAVGYNTIPENSENAKSQRERWEIGRLPITKKYAGRLLRAAIKRRSFKFFDTFVDLITPPLVNMFGITVIMAGVSFFFWLIGIHSTLLFFWLWTGVMGIGIFHVLMGFLAAEADRLLYQSLIYVPKYALWKFGIYLKALIKGASKEWIRTARD